VDKRHKKKLKRAAKRKKEKVNAQESTAKLKKQIGLFERLPAECSSCGIKFPKTREAHMSWRVTVRNQEQQVRLFCPECQKKAKELAEKQNEV
jgi:Zn finger protein HypA/HybF involved in hydrogenase expression